MVLEGVETEAVSLLQESRPSADRDVGADTTEHHEPLAVSEARSVFDTPEPSPESDTTAVQRQQDDTEVATVDAEPRPKRSGWWQRAKATFGS